MYPTFITLDELSQPEQPRISRQNKECVVCGSNSTFENYCSYCRRPRFNAADQAPARIPLSLKNEADLRCEFFSFVVFGAVTLFAIVIIIAGVLGRI